jgi:hypothetical protein
MSRSEKRMPEFDREQLCDRCLAISDRNEDGAVYYPDLCARCQKKLEAWMNGIMDILEDEGAPTVDFND